jgi:hypothetical protein
MNQAMQSIVPLPKLSALDSTIFACWGIQYDVNILKLNPFEIYLCLSPILREIITIQFTVKSVMNLLKVG